MPKMNFPRCSLCPFHHPLLNVSSQYPSFKHSEKLYPFCLLPELNTPFDPELNTLSEKSSSNECWILVGGVDVTSPSSLSSHFAFQLKLFSSLQFERVNVLLMTKSHISHQTEYLLEKMYPRKITRNWVPLKNFTPSQHPPPQLSWVLNIKVRSCWL